MSRFHVEVVCWETHQKTLVSIRDSVFIEEQGVPECLERDPCDHQYTHALAVTDAGEPIGTGRLLPDGTIGRMAVLPMWRSRGVGSALLKSLLSVAHNRGDREVMLHAQTSARDFYTHHGFVSEGEIFTEAGIPHIYMRRHL